MKSLDALRLNQLHSRLKNPRPFSDRGAISMGTWFLWVTLICSEEIQRNHETMSAFS